VDTDDAEIGAWLCQNWEMEPKLIETVKSQYDLEKTSEPRLVAMCQFAEYLCALKNLRVSGNCDEPKLEMQIWHHLGLDKNSLVDLVSAINDEVENARQIMAMAK
jgi:HD-like signal output (HDOD) protein